MLGLKLIPVSKTGPRSLSVSEHFVIGWEYDLFNFDRLNRWVWLWVLASEIHFPPPYGARRVGPVISFNSLVPGRSGCDFKKAIFQSQFTDWYLQILWW